MQCKADDLMDILSATNYRVNTVSIFISEMFEYVLLEYISDKISTTVDSQYLVTSRVCLWVSEWVIEYVCYRLCPLYLLLATERNRVV